MLKKKLLICSLMILIMTFITVGCSSETAGQEGEDNIVTDGKTYYFPAEDLEHEGTWLQWPHDYTYEDSIEAYEPIWIQMTKGLIKGENVHIIVYDEKEKERVKSVLEEEIDMNKIDFYVYPTDDVWVRDNGSIFVYDEEDNLVIQDWGFNGWGEKTPFTKCDVIPQKIGEDLDLPVVDVSDVVLEGGAVEFDGNGTCMSTLSSVVNDNRNPDFTKEQIEEYITKYYGATHFIWLNGVVGMDITDYHIDGIVKFLDDKTIITMSKEDLEYSLLSEEDYNKLMNAKNINGDLYEYVFLPLTKEDVVEIGEEGVKIPIKGSYVNFYIGNKVVLVPNYDDENDAVANSIIQELYPDREIVGIDVRDLYVDGGMIHCVTQQQPVSEIK